MNKEKITIEEFRRIRNEMDMVLQEYETSEESLTEELQAEFYSKYLTLQNELLSYDLSDIPFEEWNDFQIASSEDMIIDFSKTGANIDFNIVACYGYVNFSGCHLKGLDKLEGDRLYTNIYDEKTLEENQTLFLPDQFSPAFKEKYYRCELSIEDIVSLNDDQLKEIKEKDIFNHLDFYEKHSPILEILDIDKLVLFYRDKKDEFQAVKKALDLEKKHSTWSQKKEEMFSALLEKLKNTEIGNLKKICFEYLKNKILMGDHFFVVEDYPELFVEENKDIFLLGVDIPEEVKYRFFHRTLTIEDLIKYQSVFENIQIDYFMDSIFNVEDYFTSRYGPGEFQKMIFRHSDFFSQIADLNTAYEFFEKYFAEATAEDEIEKRLIKAVKIECLADIRREKRIPEYLESFHFELKEQIEDVEDLFNYNDNAVILNEVQNTILVSMGIANAIRFEKETGFFSHNYGTEFNQEGFLQEIGKLGFTTSQLLEMSTLSYEESVDYIAKVLDHVRKKDKSITIDYNWMGGSFRENHPEIFMPNDAPKELKHYFYSNYISPSAIEQHPEYIPYLVDKNLQGFLRLNMYLDTETPISEDATILKSFGPPSRYETTDFVEEYTTRYGNEAFLHLILRYGSYLEALHVDNSSEIESQEEIEKCVRRAIAKRLQTTKESYYTLAADSDFRNEYPELFIDLSSLDLDDATKKQIEQDYYSGTMSFAYFKKYPELKKEFISKHLSMGFRNLPTRSIDSANKLPSFSSIGIIGNEIASKISLEDILTEKKDSTDISHSIFRLKDEYMIELGIKYGKYLDYVIGEVNYYLIENQDSLRPDLINELVEKLIVNKMLKGEIIYNEEDVPSYFKTKYPILFLRDDVDQSLKDKFYNKKMTIKELLNNYEYYLEIFKDTAITAGLPIEYNWISSLFSTKQELANLYRIRILAQYERIKADKDLADEFKNYLLDNSDQIKVENIEVLGDIIHSLSITNSTSLHSVRKTLVTQLLQLDDPMNSYRKIEQIFLRNNLPLYGKMFYCFEILYPEFSKKDAGIEKFDFSEMGRLSPELKDDSLARVKRYDGKDSKTDLRFQIIYNDLIRIAVKSNSLDLRKYLDSLERGQDLYYEVLETGRELADLSESELETLSIFETHLEVIYGSSKKGQEEILELDDYDLLTKLKVLEEKFGPTKRHDLKDRIVRMFAYSAGYHSYQELRDDMEQSVKGAHERGIRYAEELQDKRFTLENFDFLRCIGDYQALGGSLDSGNFSNEFLSTIRGTSNSDTTPLDIDWSLVFDNGDIYHSVHGTPTGFGFGNVYLVIKNDNPNIRVTRDSFGNLTEREYDPTTIEMFGTQVGENWNGYETHWGSRTGIAMTDVDFILYKKSQMIDHENPYDEDGNVRYKDSDSNSYDDLPAIKFEIARHGYYIPVVDFAGKLIFTVEEYEELRKQIQGLSYYEEGNYTFSNNLDLPPISVNDFEYPNSAEIITRIDDSRMEISHKRDRIFAELKEVFDKYGLEIKTKMDGDIRPGSIEIIDTGSTGRGTNEIGEGDFDLLLRLDSDIYNDENSLHLFCADIKRVLSKFSIDKKGETARGDLRYKGVHFSDDMVVDLDISYDRKTDKVLYTTDECISDRLSTLKSLDEEKYQKVLANIILAKRVLKDAGVYKSKNSGTPQGGLGGVGVENWILEHGGSFVDAARSFCEVAEGKSFDEFKSLYTVWDFGENHTGERKEHYLHDNFVADNMDEHGYQRMVALLKEYIKKYEISLMISNKADESLMDISTHSL